MFISRKTRLRDDLITIYSFFKGSSRGQGGDLICPVTSDRTRRNKMKSEEVQIGY